MCMGGRPRKKTWQKTKLQNLDGMTSADDISVRGHTVEAVDEFVYLGSLQTSDGRCLPDTQTSCVALA